MKFHRRWAVTALFAVVSGASPVIHAALVDRGGGLIYDTHLDITWLADANYAMTSGYDADGRMIRLDGLHPNATAWVSNLSYYDSVRNVTYDDWRLPTTVQPDATCEIQYNGESYGSNCAGSEMGHLFYNELGGTAGSSILDSGDPDLALFTNLQPGIYWSGSGPNFGAWYFNFANGDQFSVNGLNAYYAWAVRDGDVAAVPLPAAAWLFGSGLAGLVGFARRKAQSA